jgi:hypothetical protein
MIRTVISLDEESNKWLDKQAPEEHVSTAELIRIRRSKIPRGENARGRAAQ